MKPAENLKKLIKNVKIDTNAEMDEAVLDDVLKALEKSKKLALSEVEGTKSAAIEPNIWRIIMKSRITKIAATAVIVIAVLTTIHYLGGSVDGTSVAWAGVLENIRSSKTVTFLARAKEHEPPIAKVMVIDPYLLRYKFLSKQYQALNGGDIAIVDVGTWKSLLLDTANKTATTVSTGPDKELLGIYNTLRNFRDREDFTVEEIGHRQVGDKKAVGYKLKKDDENREIKVWADPETKLPVLIEETLEDREGQVVRQHVLTDIVFDAELDLSLFSLKPPEGYELEEVDYGPIIAAAKRTQSTANVIRILMACKKYVAEHNGQWPDSLQDLAKYGVANKTFVNPMQPELEVGYIYLKPPASASESRIVLYEVYDSWKDGIRVGFADGHTEFIKEESDFRKRLLE